MKLTQEKKGEYVESLSRLTPTFSRFTLAKRKEIEKVLHENLSNKETCLKLGISRSTLYHERMRMGSISITYDAEFAHNHYLEAMKASPNRQPTKYKNWLTQIYKKVKELETRQNRDTVADILKTLQLMGVNASKFRKPITHAEKIEMLNLHKQGKSIVQIARIMGRSTTSVQDTIKKNKDKLNKTNEEINYELLKRKWTD